MILSTLFIFLVAPHNLQDLCSLTRHPAQAETAQSPNHWTVRKFLIILNASHFILMKIKEKHGN